MICKSNNSTEMERLLALRVSRNEFSVTRHLLANTSPELLREQRRFRVAGKHGNKSAGGSRRIFARPDCFSLMFGDRGTYVVSAISLPRPHVAAAAPVTDHATHDVTTRLLLT